MFNSDTFAKWCKKNCTGHIEHFHINGIDYIFAEENDSWIAIFEVDNGTYYPKVEAADLAHAKSWCNMVERPQVPFNVF